MKKEIRADGAPAPIGPYSQGVVTSGRLLFVAGQTPKDPATGTLPGEFRAQVERCLKNVKAIVEAAGATMADVVKVNAYLADLANFAAFNEVYATYFTAPFPARTTVGAVLPGGAVQVEIDVIVSLPS
ncbi:MAG TPA: Rid family detoxifying hydrolase [Spirochaetia bacterium]|nr:Rid family detoxifying hydrolase [Spirochaetia bacterium]